MAKIIMSPTLDVRITLEINESEARALDALVGYGDDAFLKVFYEHMGRAYLEKHERGLRELFTTVRAEVAKGLSTLDTARAFLWESSK